MTGSRARSSGLLADGALAVIVLVALVVAFACGRRMAVSDQQVAAEAVTGHATISTTEDKNGSQIWFRIQVKTDSGEVRVDPTGIHVSEQPK